MASFDLAGHTFSFSGHETFVFRYTWLKKAVDAVKRDPRVFGQNSAIVTLGALARTWCDRSDIGDWRPES